MATDTALSYSSGPAPAIVAAAYTNSSAGAASTTLYGIDAGLDQLVIHNPPNTGILTAVGPLGVDIALPAGFDIRAIAGDNVALAALEVGGRSGLYRIDLASGAARPLGPFAGAVIGLAIEPGPGSAPPAGGGTTSGPGVNVPSASAGGGSGNGCGAGSSLAVMLALAVAVGLGLRPR